jgi:hypothetical protein
MLSRLVAVLSRRKDLGAVCASVGGMRPEDGLVDGIDLGNEGRTRWVKMGWPDADGSTCCAERRATARTRTWAWNTSQSTSRLPWPLNGSVNSFLGFRKTSMGPSLLCSAPAGLLSTVAPGTSSMQEGSQSSTTVLLLSWDAEPSQTYSTRVCEAEKVGAARHRKRPRTAAIPLLPPSLACPDGSNCRCRCVRTLVCAIFLAMMLSSCWKEESDRSPLAVAPRPGDRALMLASLRKTPQLTTVLQYSLPSNLDEVAAEKLSTARCTASSAQPSWETGERAVKAAAHTWKQEASKGEQI